MLISVSPFMFIQFFVKNKSKSMPVSRVLSRMIISLGRVSPPASSGSWNRYSDLTRGSPAGRRWNDPWGSLRTPYLVLLREGFTLTRRVTPSPVGSYPTVAPLPSFEGGIVSVALSLGLPPPGVTRLPALWSPDFPQVRFR